MTADEWAAEEDYQRQRPKGWYYPVILVGLAALAVGSFRVAAAVLDKACR